MSGLSDCVPSFGIIISALSIVLGVVNSMQASGSMMLAYALQPQRLWFSIDWIE